MNISRGLLRLWVGGSIAWVVASSWITGLACKLGLNLTGNAPWCADDFVNPIEAWTETLLFIAGPPIVVGAVMVLGAWVARGFK